MLNVGAGKCNEVVAQVHVEKRHHWALMGVSVLFAAGTNDHKRSGLEKDAFIIWSRGSGAQAARSAASGPHKRTVQVLARAGVSIEGPVG